MDRLQLSVPHAVRRQAADALAGDLDAAIGTYSDVQPQRDVVIPGTNLVVDLLYSFPLGWRTAHVLHAH